MAKAPKTTELQTGTAPDMTVSAPVGSNADNTDTTVKPTETRAFALVASVFLNGKHYAAPGKVMIDLPTYSDLKRLGAIDGDWK